LKLCRLGRDRAAVNGNPATEIRQRSVLQAVDPELLTPDTVEAAIAD
jgi:hypothetical protein